MIGALSRVVVFAWCEPADMRKGFETLAAIVREEVGHDPLSGALFLFTNKQRTSAKVIYFDGTGMCLFSKRLAKGRFVALWEHAKHRTIKLSKHELDLFLEGSELIGRFRVAPAPIEKKDLEVRART
jgi:transposase